MNTRIYLDARNIEDGSPAPLKYAIAKNGATAYIPIPYKVREQDWDRKRQVVLPSEKTYKTINSALLRFKVRYDEVVAQIARRDMTAREIRDAVVEKLDPSETLKFLDRLKAYADRSKAVSTYKIYMNTHKKITMYMESLGKDPSRLKFEDITQKWLEAFRVWLSSVKVVTINAQAVQLRNIRTIFNEAIDDNLVSADLYPFRKVKIKRGATKHRAMPVEELRRFINYPTDQKHMVYRDMFLLSFFLIGINPADLFTAKYSDIIGGRLEYDRNKTKKLYSIKVEPEAMEIISKYANKDKDTLLDIWKKDETLGELESRIYGGLRNIGEWSHVGKYRVLHVTPEFKYLSMNWARHTWATIATELEIPKETISKAMGHSTGIVTDIYIAYDRKKIDEANRKVIDYVLQKTETQTSTDSESL